jgi:glycosyltransferase involved in cell wall biosynthesis
MPGLRIGLYSPYFGSTIGGGEKYLGVTAEAIRDGFPGHQVEIASPVPVDSVHYQRMLGLDLAGIHFKSTNRRVTPVHRLAARSRLLRPLRDLVIARQAAAVGADYDLLLAMIYRIPVACRARAGVMLCQFPYPGRQDLAGYQEIICQSQYVRHWVAELWDRDAAVVNPPVDIPAAEPDWRRKRSVILTVGRFVAHGHHKRHDLLVKTFLDMVAAGLHGWELHIAGSVHKDEPSQAYFDSVVRAAAGGPVHIHPDVGLDELQRLYAEAAIYWHAAGYEAEEDPEAAEHFGITTAEAMGHGAVPVVIGRGGQPELIDDGEEGYLWDQIEVLRSRTLELVADAGLRRRLGEAARRRSLDWSRPNFKRRMVGALSPVIGRLESEVAGSLG